MVVRGVLAVLLLVGAAGCGGDSPVPAPVMTSAGPTSTAAACPASGARVEPGPVDAALGLRAVTLTLTACGDGVVQLDGYPVVELLDEDGAVLDVREVRGGTTIADPGPVPLELRPGQRASAAMSWRTTVTDGVVVEAQQVRVAAAAGVEPQTSPLFVDLGTTGTYELTAWAAVTG